MEPQQDKGQRMIFMEILHEVHGQFQGEPNLRPEKSLQREERSDKYFGPQRSQELAPHRHLFIEASSC